jgi:hypothetical protein
MGLAAVGVLSVVLAAAVSGPAAFAESPGAPVLTIAPKVLERSLFAKPYQVSVITGNCPEKAEVVIKVVSPTRNFKLNRAGKGLGFVWVPSGHAEVAEVPAMYAILSSARISSMLSPAEQEKAGLCSDFRDVFQQARIRFQKDPPGDEGVKLRHEYVYGLIRMFREGGLYQYAEGAVKIDSGTFRAQLTYPASAPIGEYKIFCYLVKSGTAHLVVEDKLLVKSSPVVDWLSYYAHASPAVYGVFSALVAVMVGLLVGVVLGRGAGR